MAGAKMIVGKNKAKQFEGQKKETEKNYSAHDELNSGMERSTPTNQSGKEKKSSPFAVLSPEASKIILDLMETDPFQVDLEKVRQNRDKLNLLSQDNIFENCRTPITFGEKFIFKKIEEKIFTIWEGVLPDDRSSILSAFKNKYIVRLMVICKHLKVPQEKEIGEFFSQLKFDLATIGQVRENRDFFPAMPINYGVCRNEKNQLVHLNTEWHEVKGTYFVAPRFAPIFLENIGEKWNCADTGATEKEQDRSREQIKQKKEEFKSHLLQADNDRCRLKIYPEDTLTDPNLGHWDLFCPKDGKECGKWYEIVELPGNYKARNPLNDISENPVAIDFGTTGTVVAMRDEFGQISLLRIGARSEGKEPLDASSHYVNPTVIQIDNIKNLLEAWRELPYRPNVSFEDAQSSHEAKETLNKNYERCLTGLKTWARGKKNANAPIISDAGKNELEITLAPVTSAADIAEDFAKLPLNPIELYAFFVGLYLNNQIVDGGRIFTEYYMTFPADFESTSRQRIVESFRRGLLRSLPPSLIYGSGWKPENLRVVERASEPVAYAAAILPLLGRKMPVQPKEQPEESTRAAIIEEIRQIEQNLKSKKNSRKKIAAILQPLENKKMVTGEEKQKLFA